MLGVERPQPTTNDPEKDPYVFEKDVARSREDGTSIGQDRPLPRRLLRARGEAGRCREARHSRLGAGDERRLRPGAGLRPEPAASRRRSWWSATSATASTSTRRSTARGPTARSPTASSKRLFLADLERHLAAAARALDRPARARPVAAAGEGHPRDRGEARRAWRASSRRAGSDPRAGRRVPDALPLHDVRRGRRAAAGASSSRSTCTSTGCRTRRRSPAASAPLWRDMNEGRETVGRQAPALQRRPLRGPAGAPADAEAARAPGRGRARATGRTSIRRSSARSSSAPSTRTERHRLGAHYTPRAYVERLVKPTIEEPLRADWDLVRAEVRAAGRGRQGRGGAGAGARLPPPALRDPRARPGLRHGQLPLRDARPLQASGGGGARRSSRASATRRWGSSSRSTA